MWTKLAAALVQEFSDKNYLNEQKFGQWLVELQQRRGKSNRAIRAELFKKGLDREMIDELMEGDTDDESQRLKALVAKKRQASRYKNDPQKLKQYLVTQGFSWESIKEAMSLQESE